MAANPAKVRKSTLARPPPYHVASRPVALRAQTATPTLNGRASPADSLIASSAAFAAANTPRSPARSVNGGPKRKERDFEPPEMETNINVVVRCRGRNDREVRENSGVVVSTDGVKGQKVDLSMGPNALSNKTYLFDKVFSPAADQEMVFDQVVSPMLDEVLSGFNCTIFAYGQTGTGKTYTMSGDITDRQPLPEAAGIIPRILYALFNRLGAARDDDNSNKHPLADEINDTSVKCSFIELYNEELRDLLSIDDTTKLKIFDDNNNNNNTKKATSTLIQGMEESHITNASRGLELLKSGSLKRQVAATKCNDLSSRSHTIFTLTVYRKRTSDNGGDDYISAGKLNLVDLAGSENIQRSGAENKRAAEAGLINKSLLTLGRVINSLVERSPHVPYRESKLTRLLQDSLGGRTKTLIIATLSPARSNLEETISTLDYAFRAKNIRNKPQLNQMISKRTLLRDYTLEIEKLKTELIANRQRNGVWMSQEAFEESKIEKESQRILANEQKDKIDTMEVSLRNKVQELFNLTNLSHKTKKDTEALKAAIGSTKTLLDKTELVLAHTRKSLTEETYLRKAHQETEEKLVSVGQDLLKTIDITKGHVDGLHSGLRRRSDLHMTNRQKWSAHTAKVADMTGLIDNRLEELRRRQDELANGLTDRVQSFVSQELESVQATQSMLQGKTSDFEKTDATIQAQTAKARGDMDSVLHGITKLREDVKTKVGASLDDLSTAAQRISAGVATELDRFHNQLHNSYASLGRDFKSIFDDVVKRLNEQSAEVTELRNQMSAANVALVDAGQQSQQELQAAMIKERELAANDRQQLMAQIGKLVAASADTQESRLQGHLDWAAKRVTTLQDDHAQARHHYDRGMDEWSGHNQQLVESCVRWRESVKSKIKADWSAANETSVKIKQTADTVGTETRQVVDAQMANLDSQLTALDEITTTVKEQSGSHNSDHASSLQGLLTSVRESYSAVSAQLDESSIRANAFKSAYAEYESDMSNSNGTLALNGPVRQTVLNLREESGSAEPMDYVPTGQTPAKMTYSHATVLPRTLGREDMFSRLRSGSTSSEGRSPETSSRTSPRKASNASPSKPIVYQDLAPVASSPAEKPVEDTAVSTNSLKTIDVNVMPASSNGQVKTEQAPAEKVATVRAMPAPASYLKRAHSTQAGDAIKPPPKRMTRMTVGGVAEGRENATRPDLVETRVAEAAPAGRRRLRSRGSG